MKIMQMKSLNLIWHNLMNNNKLYMKYLIKKHQNILKFLILMKELPLKCFITYLIDLDI